ALQQRELQRERWRDRIDSLRRQVGLVDEDVTRLSAGSEERRRHLQEAEGAAATAIESLPELRAGAESAREVLASAEHDAPEAECRELEERYQNLAEQLEDITEARADLEDLISKLRQEEESRYEAVFGAVAANFHEYFSELNPGGRATLRHAEGEDGPRSGVEILVQPPRKRLQNVTLL